MRQTIETKYRTPTNSRGARIIAKASGGASLTVAYNHALNQQSNHIAAAMALRDKLTWGGAWVGGGTPQGYVFVDVSDALTVWPCGTEAGANYGVVAGEGFPALEAEG